MSLPSPASKSGTPRHDKHFTRFGAAGDSFKMFWGNISLSDVKVVLSKNKTLDLHKIVLCAHSDFFRAVFDGAVSFSEAHNNVVNLEHLVQDEEVVEQVLECLYTGVLRHAHLRAQIAQWTVAEFLQIGQLQECIFAQLTAGITAGDFELSDVLEVVLEVGHRELGKKIVRLVMDRVFADTTAGSQAVKWAVWSQVPFDWIVDVVTEPTFDVPDETKFVHQLLPVPGRCGDTWTGEQKAAMLAHFRWAHVAEADVVRAQQVHQLLSAEHAMEALLMQKLLHAPDVDARSKFFSLAAHGAGTIETLPARPVKVTDLVDPLGMFQRHCRPSTLLSSVYRKACVTRLAYRFTSNARFVPPTPQQVQARDLRRSLTRTMALTKMRKTQETQTYSMMHLVFLLRSDVATATARWQAENMVGMTVQSVVLHVRAAEAQAIPALADAARARLTAATQNNTPDTDDAPVLVDAPVTDWTLSTSVDDMRNMFKVSLSFACPPAAVHSLQFHFVLPSNSDPELAALVALLNSGQAGPMLGPVPAKYFIDLDLYGEPTVGALITDCLAHLGPEVQTYMRKVAEAGDLTLTPPASEAAEEAEPDAPNAKRRKM